MASWTGGTGAGSRPSLSRTGSSSSKSTNSYGGKTTGTYKTSSGQTYTVKETAPEDRKYPVPTKTTSGETITYVRGRSTSENAGGSTSVTTEYYGVTGSGRFVGGYSETSTYQNNGKSTIYAEKQPTPSAPTQNYTPKPNYVLAEPLTNVQVRNLVGSTQAKSKEFATVAKAKPTFNVQLYDTANKQAATATFFTSAREENIRREEAKKYVMRREKESTRGLLVAKDISSNPISNVAKAFSVAKNPRGYASQIEGTSTFIASKTANPNRQLYSEETARKFAKPIGNVVQYIGPTALFPQARKQVKATTTEFFTGVFNAPNKMVQTPVATSVDIGSDVLTGFFGGTAVGSVAKRQFANVAQKEGIAAATLQAEKVNRRFNTAFGAVAITSVAINPKGTGEQVPRIIPFGVGYTGGVNTIAGNNVVFGKLQGSTVERYNKDFFGSGRTTATITEFGNVRKENVPIAITIERESAIGRNTDLITTNIVGSYNFLGKQRYFDNTFTGTLKENPFSSRLAYGNKNSIFISTSESRSSIVTPEGTVETLRARTALFERTKYGTYQATQKGTGRVYFSDTGDMTSFSIVKTSPTRGFTRSKSDIGFNMLSRSGRLPKTRMVEYQDYLSQIERFGRAGRTRTIGFGNKLEPQIIIEQPRLGGRNTFRSSIEGSPTAFGVRSTPFGAGFIPKFGSAQVTIPKYSVSNTFKTPVTPSTSPIFDTSRSTTFKTATSFKVAPSYNIGTSSITRPGIITPPISPVTPPSFVPGFGIPPIGGGVIGKGRGEGYRASREYKYAPSITSVLYGIKGKKQKTVTGFELRPIAR